MVADRAFEAFSAFPKEVLLATQAAHPRAETLALPTRFD
jgi:hypothetical protein